MKQFLHSHWRVLPPLFIVCSLWFAWGCDHDTTPPPNPVVKHTPLSISIFPATDSLSTGDSLNISATLSGWTTDSTVSWSLIEVSPVNSQAQLGTVQAAGLTAKYTAPATIASSPLLLHVRVRSNGDTLDYTDCAVTVFSKTAPPRPTIIVNPVSVSLKPGQMQQFQVTVSGSTNTGVQWKLVSGSGSLSPSGWYTAPTDEDNTSTTAVIEAIWLGDSTVTGKAVVTIQYPGPCFRTVIQPIFISNCTISGCHNPTDHIHGLDFTTYTGLMAAVIPGDTANSELYQRITHTVKLTAYQISLVAQWIVADAPNSQCNDGLSDCDTAGTQYSTYVKPTIANYCLGCHSYRFAATCDSLDFTNFNTVAQVAQTGLLLHVLRHQYPDPSMPQYGPQLDSCTIARIADWVKRGAPND